MYIKSYFSDKGVPKTGLTPSLWVWELNGTPVISGSNMTEIAGGYYYYDFTGYDDEEDYSIRADGGASLSNVDRYCVNTNETEYHEQLDDIETDIAFTKDIEGGKWQLINNQMVFWAADNVTEVARFNLYDVNGAPSVRNVFKRVRC